MNRTCGDCSKCCDLLPVKELGKAANERCVHQSYAKGCKIYQKEGFPVSCRYWTCRWLTDTDTAAMSRPDRSGYVIDVMPDFIRITPNGGETQNVPVIQVWVDPKRPDAHKDPHLRAYLEKQAALGNAALIRFGSHDGFVLFAPIFTGAGWVEAGGITDPHEHTAGEIVEALGEGWEAVDLSKEAQHK